MCCRSASPAGHSVVMARTSMLVLAFASAVTALHCPVSLRPRGALHLLVGDGAGSGAVALCRRGKASCARHGCQQLLEASSADTLQEGEDAYTLADLEAYARPWGVTLSVSNTANLYRIEAKDETGDLVGYTSGFTLGDYLHLDTVQTRRKASAYHPGAPNAPAPGEERNLPWVKTTSSGFQLGAVLGCAAVWVGRERGCKWAELLAIKDFEDQHARLVRYYSIAGFRAMREVGDELSSFGDRLVWGGVGTLMGVELEAFTRRWTPLIKGGARAARPGEGSSAGGGREARAAEVSSPP